MHFLLDSSMGLGAGVGIAGAGIGAGLAAIGAGVGISRIGGSGAEAVARQPEAVGEIRGLAIITAAFVEGVALFAIVICLLVAFVELGPLVTKLVNEVPAKTGSIRIERMVPQTHAVACVKDGVLVVPEATRPRIPPPDRAV